MVASPTVGRPAQGFTSQRAQRWVLAAALLSAMIYGFRRIIEPVSGNTTSSGTAAQKLAGTGTPPTLSHWAIAYGAGFLMLSVISLGAPELAASLAMLMVVGELLSNGTTIVADITGLETSGTGQSGLPADVKLAAGAANITQGAADTASAAVGAAGSVGAAGVKGAGSTASAGAHGVTGGF